MMANYEWWWLLELPTTIVTLTLDIAGELEWYPEEEEFYDALKRLVLLRTMSLKSTPELNFLLFDLAFIGFSDGVTVPRELPCPLLSQLTLTRMIIDPATLVDMVSVRGNDHKTHGVAPLVITVEDCRYDDISDDRIWNGTYRTALEVVSLRYNR